MFLNEINKIVQVVDQTLDAQLQPVVAYQAEKRRLTVVESAGDRLDFDQHGIHDALILDGDLLEPGMEFSGPAIIQEPSVTCVIPPGCRASIDGYGNYHIHLQG